MKRLLHKKELEQGQYKISATSRSALDWSILNQRFATTRGSSKVAQSANMAMRRIAYGLVCHGLDALMRDKIYTSIGHLQRAKRVTSGFPRFGASVKLQNRYLLTIQTKQTNRTE
jgi:hypothetical protein